MAIDLLSVAVESLRVSSCVFSRAELRSPFGVKAPPTTAAIFHVVVQGPVYARPSAAKRAEKLERGDLVLFPRGAGHVILSSARARAVDIRRLPIKNTRGPCQTIHGGGDGATCELICGSITMDEVGADLLVGSLPEMLCVRGQVDTTTWLARTLEDLAHELDSAAPGASALMLRLADILVIQLFRHWATEAPAGLLAATTDPQISRALLALMRAPADNTSAGRLAKHAGMSKTSFYKRFTSLVGEPPASYIRRWRVFLATKILRDGGTVEEAAVSTGYSSGKALADVFRRTYGKSPRAWLKSGPASVAVPTPAPGW